MKTLPLIIGQETIELECIGERVEGCVAGTEDPALAESWLLGEIKIAGVGFHVEALQVVVDVVNEMYVAQHDGAQGLLERWHEGVDSDGKLQTIEIAGNEYVLLILPHDE